MDRPEVDHVFQVAKTPLDFHQLFVLFHRVHRRDVRFAGGDHIPPLQPPFASQMRGMLEELERAVSQSPIVIPRSMIPRKDSPGRRSDLFRPHQSACCDAGLQTFQGLAGLLHRPLALRLFVLPAVFRIDHEHPEALFARLHFLHPRLGRRLLLARGDPDRTRLPLRFIGHQPIQRAIPGVELAMMHPHAISLIPVRQEPPAISRTNVIGFQPAGQRVLALGPNQPIGK